MATTKKPVKKAVVKKQAAKKSPAKKVAAKKDERGKKLSSVSFDIYEKGIVTNGEISIKHLMGVHDVVCRMISEARMEATKLMIGRMLGDQVSVAKKPVAKKAK